MQLAPSAKCSLLATSVGDDPARVGTVPVVGSFWTPAVLHARCSLCLHLHQQHLGAPKKTPSPHLRSCRRPASSHFFNSATICVDDVHEVQELPMQMTAGDPLTPRPFSPDCQVKPGGGRLLQSVPGSRQSGDWEALSCDTSRSRCKLMRHGHNDGACCVVAHRPRTL